MLNYIIVKHINNIRKDSFHFRVCEIKRRHICFIDFGKDKGDKFNYLKQTIDLLNQLMAQTPNYQFVSLSPSKHIIY